MRRRKANHRDIGTTLLAFALVLALLGLGTPAIGAAQKGGKTGGKSADSSDKSSSGSSKSGSSKSTTKSSTKTTQAVTKAGNAMQTQARVAVARTGRTYYKRPPMWKPLTKKVVVKRSYYAGYYPWGWGGVGYGAYYGGFYDPWWYDGYDEDYGASYEGSLHLKVTPRDASVYVDGYLAGIVDEFDGTFQRLRLESGPHRIEVRQDGYEPLMFEVKIAPDETVKYEGDLQRLP
jgi:hypothetical protein